MGKGNFPLYAFNRGEVSRLALGRTDLDRLRLSAEEQINWQPLVLGPMTLRPGLKFIGETRASATKQAFFIPFVFGNDDVAAIELTGNAATTGLMRIWLPSDDESTSNAHASANTTQAEVNAANALVNAKEDGDLEVLTRGQVATTVVQGEFTSSGAWVEDASDGCSAEILNGVLTLNAAARGGFASCKSNHLTAGHLTVNPTDRNREHALKIVVNRGPVRFRAGSSMSNQGGVGDDYIEDTELAEGTHSLAFTPTTGRVFVQFESNDQVDRIVESIAIEPAGVLTLPTPWAEVDLPFVRYAQSGDVIFLACKGVHPMRIERRSARSWSIVKYLPKNGPLKATPTADVKLEPTVLEGNGQLSSNRAFFTSDHVGCLFRLFTKGQSKKATLGAEDTYTDPIRITGVTGSDRKFVVNVSDLTGKTRLQLERSTEDGENGIGFQKVLDIAKDGQRSYLDLEKTGTNADNDPGTGNFTNVIAFYRVGIDNHYKGGAPTVDFRDGSGNAALKSGGGAGICRVTGVIDAKLARIEVIKPFTALRATDNWQEGEWSAASGYPSSVGFHDGRLWWAGADKIWGSVSDDYSNFDIDKEGDAGPIARSVGFGPVDNINWILPLTRLILGRDEAETSIRSSSFDEPITPTSFTLKDCSTKGTARIAALKCDTRGVFVSKSGRKAYELALDMQAADYAAHDLTRLHPEISGSGFTRLCISHNPDTAIHFVRADGQAAVLLYDKEDQVEAWWRIETDGIIEDAFVLPGEAEDNVYYVINRGTVQAPRRSLEKFARRDQCSGLPEARLSDSFIVDTSGQKTISGLSHLAGKSVVAWGWNNNATSGVDLGTFTIANNKIDLTTAYDNVCVGLAYDASFTSAKLAYAADRGTAVNQKKRVDHVGLVLYDTHYQGLRYGQRADVLDNLPLVSEGAEITANTVHAEFDEPMIEVPGEWDTDSRLMLKASSPRPCTVAAAVVGMQTHG